MFNEFDTNHDASLSTAELEELLLQLGASASPVAEVLQKFDQDGSGSVSCFRFWCCAAILTHKACDRSILVSFGDCMRGW
jgi:Ca2+-binding EF-hand superfamily protein